MAKSSVIARFMFDDDTEYQLQINLESVQLMILRKLIESWVKLKNGIVDLKDLADVFRLFR